MGLSAAVMPPESVLEELADLVRSVGGDSRELDAIPARYMHLPISYFGNVARRDAVELADIIRLNVATLPRPELFFSGGTALEWPGDESVWAKLDGDVDDLMTTGRAVAAAVKHLGFVVDRRMFRPWLAVAMITSFTTAPYLQRVVDALEGARGPVWTLEEVCLLRKIPAAPDAEEGGRFEVMDRFPLAAARPAADAPSAPH